MLLGVCVRVSHEYVKDSRKRIIFKEMGAVQYDKYTLSISEDEVSLWTIEGRLRVPYEASRADRALLEYRQGAGYLAGLSNEYYFFVPCEAEDIPPQFIRK